eukprot:735092-Rhodomonas_salina.1
MSGTHLADGGMCLRARALCAVRYSPSVCCYGMSGTRQAYAAMGLSGTDLGHGATRAGYQRIGA